MKEKRENTILKTALAILAILLTLGNVDVADAQGTGSIIPLYLYPSVDNQGNHNWQPLINAHAQNSIPVWAIVNVNSGPGTRVDRNYLTAVNRLKSAGIKTLGYVSTSYANVPISQVNSNVNKWRTWYSVDGIFFDEMTNENNNSQVTYYNKCSTYAKSIGLNYTVGNPGTDVAPEYVPVMDTIMIYETGSGFPSTKEMCGWHATQPKSKWGIFPYNIPNLNATQIQIAKTCVGYIYVTNDKGDNPWDELPPYLSQLFGLLKV